MGTPSLNNGTAGPKGESSASLAWKPHLSSVARLCKTLWTAVLTTAFCAAVAFLTASRVALPLLVPVSRAAWTNTEQVEIRSPLDATRVENCVALHNQVQAGDEICRVVNETVDRREIRELAQDRKIMNARLSRVRAQRQATELQLSEQVDAWNAFVAFTAKSVEAQLNVVAAKIKAARADHRFQAETNQHLKTLPPFTVSGQERDEAECRVAIAAARLESLNFERRALETQLKAISTPGDPSALQSRLPTAKSRS